LVIFRRWLFYYDLPNSCLRKSRVSSGLPSNCKFDINDEQPAVRTGVAAVRTASQCKCGSAAQIAKNVMGGGNGSLHGGFGFGQSAGSLLVGLDVASKMLAQFCIEFFGRAGTGKWRR